MYILVYIDKQPRQWHGEKDGSMEKKDNLERGRVIDPFFWDRGAEKQQKLEQSKKKDKKGVGKMIKIIIKKSAPPMKD